MKPPSKETYRDGETIMSLLVRYLLIAVCLLDLFGRPANAYLDPGVGSQALQIGMAGLLGLAFTLRSSIARLLDAFRRKR